MKSDIEIARSIELKKIKHKTRNVCGGEYYKKLPEGAEIDSYSASGIPALMLLFPAKK